jgi:hypothetical protein
MSPVLEKLSEQVVSILEMPIKSTLGDSQVAGESSNGDF